MTYVYALSVHDDEGNQIVGIPVSPDMVVKILADALAEKARPVEEIAPPKDKGGRPPKSTAEPQTGPGKRPPQPCCGTTGSRHFKGCLNAPGSTKPFTQPDSIPRLPHVMVRKSLSAEEYADLRDAMHDREFQSARYALSNKLSPTEVNNAVVSKNYDDYLGVRG